MVSILLNQKNKLFEAKELIDIKFHQNLIYIYARRLIYITKKDGLGLAICKKNLLKLLSGVKIILPYGDR